MNDFVAACTLSCDDWLNDFSDSYDYEFSKSFEKEMNRLIDKMRKNKYHKLTKKTMQILLIAAIILLFATTAFAIPSSRKHIIKQFKDHFSYSVAEIDDVENVKGIAVGYMPDGFEINNEYISEKEILQEYVCKNNWVNVDKSSIDFSVNIDLSDKELMVINNIEYLYFNTGSTNGMIWNNGLYIYTVSGNIEKEELIKIALEIE